MAPFTKENFACHFISENYCSRALRSKICCSRAFCVRDDHWWSPQFLHQAFLVYKMVWSGGLGFYPRWVWDSKNSGPSSALASHGTLIFLWMIHCSHLTLCISPMDGAHLNPHFQQLHAAEAGGGHKSLLVLVSAYLYLKVQILPLSKSSIARDIPSLACRNGRWYSASFYINPLPCWSEDLMVKSPL